APERNGGQAGRDANGRPPGRASAILRRTRQDAAQDHLRARFDRRRKVFPPTRGLVRLPAVRTKSIRYRSAHRELPGDSLERISLPGTGMANEPLTYWDYLRLIPLLNQQGGLEGDDSRLSEDELHFIVVHQTFELWLKLILRELRLARDRMLAEWVPERHIPHVVRHLRRVNEILKLAVESFAVLETLTPQDFLAFRQKLGASSGFQSYQMRQMELLLGLEMVDRKRLNLPGDPLAEIEAAARASADGAAVIRDLERAKGEASLRAALVKWLERTPIHGSMPADLADREV